MPITATYTVKCDFCFGQLDDYYDTRAEAEDARREAGWESGIGGTACPPHQMFESREAVVS